MISINKELLANRFSTASDLYEDATPIQSKMAQNLFNEVLRLTFGKNIRNILELGCGSGRLTKKLVKEFPRSKITAIDIAPNMVDLAKTKSPTVNFIIGDIEKVVFDFEEKFDLIISNATIQWFENKQKTMQQINNLLEQSGVLAIATFGDKTFYELSKSFAESYLKHDLEVRSHVVKMPSVATWKTIFSNEKVSEEIFTQTFPSVREFLKSIQSAGAVNSAKENSTIPKKVLLDMMKYYAENFTDENEVLATYHVCYIFS
jgi:malonyl-CoA O-methyltransferase